MHLPGEAEDIRTILKQDNQPRGRDPKSEPPKHAAGVPTNRRRSLQYDGESKSFRTGLLERELQMAQIFATRYSFIVILWVSLVSFAAIILFVASQRVIPKVSIYFVMTQSGNFWIHPCMLMMRRVVVLCLPVLLHINFLLKAFIPAFPDSMTESESLDGGAGAYSNECSETRKQVCLKTPVCLTPQDLWTWRKMFSLPNEYWGIAYICLPSMLKRGHYKKTALSFLHRMSQ
jgi:hypothetical protein